MDLDCKQQTEKFMWLLTGRGSFEFPEEACVHTWMLHPDTKKHSSKFYYQNEIPKAVEVAQQVSGKLHVYVGLGYRRNKIINNGRGKENDICGIPCLWAEVDVKDGVHKYDNLPETKEDAKNLVKSVLPSMPPNCIVDSGGGIYAYWFFDKPWIFANDEEREAAVKLNFNLFHALKKKAEEKNWKVDNVGDLPRILRLSGTKNIKDSNSIRIAKIVECADRFYTVEELSRQFPDIPKEKKKPEKIQTASAEPKAQKVDDYPPSDFNQIKSKCAFINHCVEDAATLPEPEWYAALTIACRCENGEEICHQISEGYPGYDDEQTELKIEHALSDTGPMTCIVIESTLSDQYCKTCPFKDKIVSPINLGSKVNGGNNYIDELNKKYAVVLVGGKCCILKEAFDPIHKRPDINLMSFQDFHNWLADEHVLVHGNSKPISKIWVNSSNKRKYEGIIFSPGGDEPGYYNLWRGFAIKPKKGDCSLYLDHIKNIIASGDERTNQWILAWMAGIIQNPGGDRPGTSIVLRGKQGTGKGTFVQYFAKIFGGHFLHIQNQNHLTGHFNSHLKDSLLVFCDEAIWGGNKDAEGVLKAMVTEDTIMVEAKGKDAYPVKNHINIIVASNNDWVVPAGLEERRFMVLDVNDSAKGNIDYFNDIKSQMENGGCEALHYFLKNLDISNVNLRKIPRTTALFEQMLHSMPPFKKWWFDALQREGFYKEDGENEIDKYLPWHEPHEKQTLYKTYLLASKDINGKNHLSDSQFGRQLNEICPNITVKRKSIFKDSNERIRPFYYILPPLADCRKQFEKLIDMESKIVWSPENDLDEINPEKAQSATEPNNVTPYHYNVLHSRMA